MRRLPSILASLALLVLVIVLFYPALFQDKILAPLDITTTLLPPWNETANGTKPHNQSPSDAVTQYIPYRIFVEESLHKDGYIGWNPYEMGGYSMAANTMALPGTWSMQLHRWLPFKDAWNFGIIAEFLIAGFGMLVFLRSRCLPWIPCLIGTVAFMFNAQFIIWIHHRWALSSFCWMPWLLWSAVDWKGLPDLSLRRCLLPLWIALALMGASLQHTVFVFLTCTCLFLAALPPVRSIGSQTVSSTARLITSWAIVWLLAVGMAAFTIIPQIQGYLANIAIGHVRGGIGYEEGPSQILFHLLLIPARIWPWLAGDPQSLDAFRLLKSGYMNLNYIGTIPMLLAFAGLFVRGLPRAAKWLILVGLIIPLTPLVGPLYHRVELLFILGAAWITAELLHKVQSTKHQTPNTAAQPSKPFSLSAFQPFHLYFNRLLISAVAGIGLALLVGTLLPSSIRNKIESTVVSKTLARSSESQFGGHQDWIASRAIEWTRRFSLTHPKTAWAYGLLILGTTGLVLTIKNQKNAFGNQQSIPPESLNHQAKDVRNTETPSAQRHQITTEHKAQSTNYVPQALILLATTMELSTIFHGWCTFTDPSHLTSPHPAIEEIRTQAGPHRVLQYSPEAGFADIFATPNLLASRLIPSIDAYESIQYFSPLTTLIDHPRALQLPLAGVALAVHPSDKPVPSGTESWTASPLTPAYNLLTSPFTPPPIAIGQGDAPATPPAILEALTHATPITPTLHTPNRLTLPLANQQSENPSWLRLLRNWHPGWKWRHSGSSTWLPFRNGPDAACWLDRIPPHAHHLEIQFFPRPLWLTLISLASAMAWLGVSLLGATARPVNQ